MHKCATINVTLSLPLIFPINVLEGALLKVVNTNVWFELKIKIYFLALMRLKKIIQKKFKFEKIRENLRNSML